MKATVEPLEANKVKVSVEVDEAEFDRALDRAFRKIAMEIRIPGFRPGKAPRRLLESRIGSEYARQQALQDSIPEYYAQAVLDNEVDVIAPPEVDITAGQESGPLSFEAVVEVRPRVIVPGYASLRVEIPSPLASDEEIAERIDRVRGQFASLQLVDRPAADDDHVTIDVTGSRDGEPLDGLVATDYLYHVGSGSVVPELDDHLRGASAGDVLEFHAMHPDPDEEGIDFRVEVKAVQERVLPELTDEWVSGMSEFATVDELRADVARSIRMMKLVSANVALRNKTAEALGKLVDDEIPDALVQPELRARINQFAQRIGAQGIGLEQWLQAMGKEPAEFGAEMRVTATDAVRVDLALRAVAEAEGLDVDDADLDEEYERIIQRQGPKAKVKVKDVRKYFERSGQVHDLKADLRKRKALEWLVDRVEIVDPDGNVIRREDLEPPSESKAEVEAAVDDALVDVTASAGAEPIDESEEGDSE